MAAASIIASVVTGGSNSHQTVAEEVNNVATDFVSQGVVGAFTSGSPNTGAFAVTQDASPDMGVTILSGRAYVSGTPSGQDAQVLNARMTSNYTNYTINANSSGSTKYDWIYLQFNATNANTPSAAADNVITLFTSRSTSNATDNGSPPTYGLLLAVVTVANGASSITNGNITDKRVQSQLSVQSAATTGWQTLGFPLTYGANNGNKEFTVTTPNNLTGVLSPGMKLNITRSVTPPTQCMSFTAASSQYATKATPTGITFTSAFTCEAWVYLTAYPTGSNTGMIIDRFDGTNGWFLYVNASGQVYIQFNAGANSTNFATYQSIPLNRWVHVAGVISSVASKTGAVYINGVSVPTNSPAATATSLTQAGNLTIGAQQTGAAGTFFNGYISEARVWSVAQTQAQIQANMAINCVGNETNLVALFQGSGNFNDSTSNANNLTATNGAIATQANNPYNATEYAIVRAVSYSNPTTTVTLFTDDAGTIPNQTLNTPQYSTATEPYGWPRNLISDKVWGTVLWCANVSTTATATGTQLSGATLTFTVPTNGKKFVIKAYNSNVTASTTGVLDAYVGSTQVVRAQVPNVTNGQTLILITLPIVIASGQQTVSLDAWSSAAGTFTWPAATTAPAWFTVEEA